jgi:hypothetical protein
MRKYIGIDIGKKGAVCILTEDGEEAARAKMPMIKNVVDWHTLNRMLELHEGFNGMVVFEKLGVIFGSSKKTAFSMGEQYGSVRMCCIANSLIYTEVSPKKWQAEMFAGQEKIYKTGSKTKVDTKAMALVAAKRLFPDMEDLTLSDKAQVPHDGFIDALLMAEYARRKYPR